MTMPTKDLYLYSYFQKANKEPRGYHQSVSRLLSIVLTTIIPVYFEPSMLINLLMLFFKD